MRLHENANDNRIFSISNTCKTYLIQLLFNIAYTLKVSMILNTDYINSARSPLIPVSARQPLKSLLGYNLRYVSPYLDRL